MLDINARLFTGVSDRTTADSFVVGRVASVRAILADLQRTQVTDDQLPGLRELLAGLGEAHSAFNTASLLRARGVNALLVDLTDRREPNPPPLDELLRARLSGIDLADTLPVVTGHAHCRERLVATYQRRYAEIMFSRIAAVTNAREAIIYRGHHLSSADPGIVSERRTGPIGRTNYDVADQLARLGTGVVHPAAARVLRHADIVLRVKCAFDPEHEGTTIENGYRSEVAHVEVIAGRRGIHALEVFDHEMLDQRDERAAIQRALDAHSITAIASDGNANSVVHYLACDAVWANRVKSEIERAFTNSASTVRRVAVVNPIGSNLNLPGVLSDCITAMSDEGIPVLAISQSIRGVDIKLIVNDADYERAVVCLHERLVEQSSSGSGHIGRGSRP